MTDVGGAQVPPTTFPVPNTPALRFRAVRLLPFLGIALAALALAACDGNGNGGHAWAGPPDPESDGTVDVSGFAEHQESVDELWEGSAVMAAAEFLRLDERTATRTSILGTAGPEGMGPETVVVTLDGLLDDSIRAERWTIVFEPDNETYLISSAVWAQRCQPGRGHQDFASRPARNERARPGMPGPRRPVAPVGEACLAPTPTWI